MELNRHNAIELLFTSTDIEESMLYLLNECTFHQQLQTQFDLMGDLLQQIRALRHVLLKFPDIPEERQHRLKMLIKMLGEYQQFFTNELNAIDQQ